MNIYQKLIEVRKAVPYLKKDNKGHQFQFVSSSQTLGNVRAKMDEMGLLLVPSVLDNKVSDHTTKNGGHEYFTEINVKFTWINAETPEETVECMWLGQGLDSGEKGVGKALTYAEKYFLLKFFNIATDKDDPDSFQGRIESTKQQPKATLAEWKASIAAAIESGEVKDVSTLAAWRAANGVKIFATLPKADQPTYKKYLDSIGADFKRKEEA